MTQNITINGMMCQGCANNVKDIISQLDGVESVTVDLEKKEASIIAEKEVSKEIIQEAFEENEKDYEVE